MLETLRNNAINTVKFFQRFRGKIIYLSSASVYGNARSIPTSESLEPNPGDPYACSKLIAELFLQKRGNYTTLRLSNVYGERQRPDNPCCGVVAKFVDNVINKKPVTLNTTQTRDYTYVGDVVEAVAAAVDLPGLNTEINIGTGVEISTLDLAEEIWGIIGYDTGAQYTERRAIDTVERRCFDIAKAKELLKWQPKTTLEEGLRKTIKWQREEFVCVAARPEGHSR
jgi:UDP-glucose 4-epimerase